MNNDDLVKSEVDALTAVYSALRPLGAEAQQWVIRTVLDRLNLPRTGIPEAGSPQAPREEGRAESKPPPTASHEPEAQSDDLQGINPVSLKWMQRNQFTQSDLSQLFSLGLDEIDLVAPKVPGGNKKERLRSVLLLKAIAAYLGSGAPRASYESVREAAIHYDAYDRPNFAANLRDFARDVGGSKASGYSLTAAGMTAAAQLISSVVNGQGVNPTQQVSRTVETSGRKKS